MVAKGRESVTTTTLQTFSTNRHQMSGATLKMFQIHAGVHRRWPGKLKKKKFFSYTFVIFFCLFH